MCVAGYIFAAVQTVELRDALAQGHAVPNVAVAAEGTACFLVRLGSLILIPLMALWCSAYTWIPSVACAALAIVAMKCGLMPHTIAMVVLLALCMLVTWASVGREADDPPSGHGTAVTRSAPAYGAERPQERVSGAPERPGPTGVAPSPSTISEAPVVVDGMRFVVDQMRRPLELDGDQADMLVPIAVVVLSVAKIDAQWSREGRFGYICPGGFGGGPGRYEKAQSWLSSKPETWMPMLHALADFPERFSFSDGRHRFAAWRDAGHTMMAFCVPRDCAVGMLEHFG
jgi:hypothetical protein